VVDSGVEVRTVSATGGAKGEKDSQLAWCDPLTLLELGKVYGFGARKYDPSNYRKGYEWSKSFSAMMRHALAFWSGEDNDPESGLPHMAHAAWHCLTMISFMREHRQFDDRFHGTADLMTATYEAIEEVEDVATTAAREAFAAYAQRAQDEGWGTMTADGTLQTTTPPRVDPHHIEQARDVLAEDPLPEAGHLLRRDLPA